MNFANTVTTILLIEEDPDVVRALTEAIKEQGKVVFATSMQEGINKANQHHPDIVLVDINLSRDEAYSLCKILRARDSEEKLPIIFSVDRHVHAEESYALEAGASDIIYKPLTLSAVSARVKTHLKLRRHSQKLSSLTELDNLTGVHNYAYFIKALEQEWRRHLRQKLWLTVSIIDLQHFSAFNRSAGRAQGDACLKLIGSVLKNSARRPAEIIARHQGAQFICLLPNTNQEHADKFKAWISGQIHDLKITHPANDRHTLHARIGLAAMIPQKDNTPMDLLAATKHALAQIPDDDLTNAGSDE